MTKKWGILAGRDKQLWHFSPQLFVHLPILWGNLFWG
jgi:hypothetical protein